MLASMKKGMLVCRASEKMRSELGVYKSEHI